MIPQLFHRYTAKDATTTIAEKRPVLTAILDTPLLALPLDEEDPLPEEVGEPDEALADGPIFVTLAGQVRLKSGVVVSFEPMIPKLGLGVVGSESCRVYQNVLRTPKIAHPTSSQYV